MNNIGKRLLYLIESKGLTPYKLHKRTGVSQSVLSRIINKNTNPNESNLKAIVDFFKIDEGWFLTGVENDKVNDNEIEYHSPKTASKTKDDEIAILKKIIKDKEQIIDLLNEKIEFLQINCTCAQKKTTA